MSTFPFVWIKQPGLPVPGFMPQVPKSPSVSKLKYSSAPADNQTDEKWYGNYRVEALIGEGNGTSIYKALNIFDGNTYALKVMRNIAKNQRECNIHSKFSKGFNHLVLYVEHFTQGRFLVLVMELYARNLLGIEISPCRILNIILATSRSMVEIDSRYMISDDIKPENYFMRGGGSRRIALGDFGGMRRKGELSTEHTAPYCAPEQMAGPTRSNATMIHCWGATLEKIITKKVGVCRAGMSLSQFTPWVGRFFDPLIYQCTRKEPHLRPSPVEVLAEVQHLARIAQYDLCPVHQLPQLGCGSCMACNIR